MSVLPSTSLEVFSHRIRTHWSSLVGTHYEGREARTRCYTLVTHPSFRSDGDIRGDKSPGPAFVEMEEAKKPGPGFHARGEYWPKQ